jgi:hypothetical protein
LSLGTSERLAAGHPTHFPSEATQASERKPARYFTYILAPTLFWSSPLTIICQALLSKGAKVYIAARSKSRADSAIEWLKTETGGKAAIFLQLDLADLASVRTAVVEFKQYVLPSVYLFKLIYV